MEAAQSKLSFSTGPKVHRRGTQNPAKSTGISYRGGSKVGSFLTSETTLLHLEKSSGFRRPVNQQQKESEDPQGVRG